MSEDENERARALAYIPCLKLGSQSLTTGVQCPHGQVGGGYPPIPLGSLTHVTDLLVGDWWIGSA